MSESHAKIETGTEKKDKVTKPSGTEEKPQNEEEIGKKEKMALQDLY